MTEQTAVGEMLTRESTWVRSTWNAGAAAGMRWNGKQWEQIVEKMEEKSDAKLTEEVEEQFDQVINTFNEVRRTGVPLIYEKEVIQGICGFNKARAAAGMRWNVKEWERSVEKMEEIVKKETRRFSTNALQKLKVEKQKEMIEEKKETKHMRPLEEEKQHERKEEENNPEDTEEGDEEVNSHKEEEGFEESR